MLPTKNKFDEYVKMGLLRKQRHQLDVLGLEEKPLEIYNYTELTQFDRLWNNVTRNARGIVFDDKGRCVVRCLPKFFNSDEPNAILETPKNESFRIFEKLDGSLIQITNDTEYGLIVTSKGSFASDQAVWATELLQEYNYDFLPGYTFVFELIHPANRIVVNYGSTKKLILLTTIRNSDGYEVPYNKLAWNNKPREFTVQEMNEVMKQSNFEGVVYVYESGYRTKVKTEEYVRMHRIMTGYSAKTIWESLKDNKPLDLVNMPEEFMTWFENTKTNLIQQYKSIENEGKTLFNEVRIYSEGKDIAGHIENFEHKSIVWSMLKQKDYSDYIWKVIKPKGNTNPFENK